MEYIPPPNDYQSSYVFFTKDRYASSVVGFLPFITDLLDWITPDDDDDSFDEE